MNNSTFSILIAFAIIFSTFISADSSAVGDSSGPSMNVNYEVILSQHYSIFGYTRENILLNVWGSTGGPPPAGSDITAYEVDLFFTWTYGGNITPPNFNVSQQQGFYGQTIVNVTMPAETTSYNFTIRGTLDAPSVFYRNVVYLPRIQTSSNFSGLTYFDTLIPETPGIQIFSLVPPPGPNVTAQQVVIQGTHYYSVLLPNGVKYLQIVYQQPYRDYFVLLYLIGFIALIPTLAYLISKARFLWLQRTRGLIQPNGGGRSSGLVLSYFTRSVSYLARFNSRRWLTLLVISGILMVSVAFIFGPAPTPRAYLAADPGTAAGIGPYIVAANFSYLTPVQVTGTDKFDTMSTLGSFDVVILADYSVPANTEGLVSSKNIIVITDQVQNSQLAILEGLYSSPPYHLVLINDASQLTQALAKIPLRANYLGFHWSEGTYVDAELFEAVMSFVLVFFALGFFSSAVIEVGKKGLSGISEAVAYSFLIFMFSQMIYIVTTVFLGIPVGLHASTSHDTTAVGLLGFGGGSRPRMVVGGLGFLAGVMSSKEARARLDYLGFFIFSSLVVFILIDPLNIGNLFGQFVLVNLTSAPTVGAGGATYEGVRGLIGQFMSTFGDLASLGYYSQHGAAFYYVGAIPFALYSRLSKTTSTFLVLLCAYICAAGFVRIADMIPLKAIASVIPGIALGGVVALGFLGIGLVEYALRK
jgi:hypothetical protein